MKMLNLLLLFPLVVLAGCSSSSAQQEPEVSREEFIALQSEVAELKARTAVITAGAPNPVQIAARYPVYFEDSSCSTQPYVTTGGISRMAIRQGVAMRFTLPGQTDGDPATYGYVPPGTEHVVIDTTVGGTLGSRLRASGDCETDNLPPSVIVYPVTMNTDDQAYEDETCVPAGGYLEGTEISSFAAVAPDGLLGGRFIDVPSCTGYIVRFDGDSVPILLGIQQP